MLCLFLVGAAAGCYFAKGSRGFLSLNGTWVLFTASADSGILMLSLFAARWRLYPLVPALILPGKGVLTSCLVIWQCQSGTVGEYLRCCARCGLLTGVSLGCLLVAFLHGMSLRAQRGKREDRRRTTASLLGVLLAILWITALVQWWICKAL